MRKSIDFFPLENLNLRLFELVEVIFFNNIVIFLSLVPITIRFIILFARILVSHVGILGKFQLVKEEKDD